MSNQRQSFRIDYSIPAQLYYAGSVFDATVLNLSAGGARIETRCAAREGRSCKLVIELAPELTKSRTQEELVMHAEILDANSSEKGYVCRLRSIDPAGSAAHEQAAHVVSALQRIQRAEERGVDKASPMQISQDSIRRERPGINKRLRTSWVDKFKRSRRD